MGDVTNPFDPVVTGNNSCYMAQGYYPISDLQAILPDEMTIPDQDVMKANYPETTMIEG